MKHDFEWVSTHAKWCLITIKSYSTGWTDYSYGFTLSYLLASNRRAWLLSNFCCGERLPFNYRQILVSDLSVAFLSF